MSGSGGPDCEASGIDPLWCAVFQGLRTHGVVFGAVLPEQLLQFSRSLVFTDEKALAFQASEPTLNHDIARPVSVAVHALSIVEITKELFVVVTGKLASLVRIVMLAGVPYLSTPSFKAARISRLM